MPASFVPLAAIPQPAFLLDAGGRIVAANGAADALAGRPLAGLSLDEAVRIFRHRRPDGTPLGPEDLPSARILAGGSGDAVEVPLVITAADGRTLEIIGTASPVMDGDTVTGVLVVWRDVTGQRRAERALAESEERFKSVLENTRDVLVRFNLQSGKYEYISPSCEALTGYTVDEYGAMDLEAALAMVHPDDLPGLRAAQAQSEETGAAEAEYRQRTRNGEWIRVSSRMSVIRDESGRPLYRIISIRDITGQKAAETALRESEARFRGILDSSLDALYRRNLRTGRFEYVSAAVEPIIGSAVAEVLGWNEDAILERVHPDDLPRVQSEKMGAPPAVPEGAIEYRFRRGDGTYSWLSDRFRITRGADDRPLYRDGILRDVTERRETEEALRQSQSNYRNLFDSMSEVLLVMEIVHDVDGTPIDYVVRDANKAIVRTSGRTPDELLNRKASELWGVIEQYWLDTYDRIAKTGNPEYFTYYGSALDKWYENYGWKVDENIIATISQDITERKRAEEALRESEEKFRTVIETAGEGFVIAGPDGPYTFVNRRMAEMLGYPVEEILGKSSVDFTFDRCLAKVFRSRETLHEGAGDQGEFRFRRKDGSELWTRYNATPMFDERGDHIANFVFHTDITERKRQEEALKESEAKYRSLFDSLDAGFCIIEVLFDPAGTPVDYVFLEANPAFVQQTGLSDAIGKRMRDLNPRHEEHWFEIYGDIARTGEARRFAAPAVLIDGWYEVYAFPIGEPGSNRVAILFSDITERKHAEAALRTNEERFRSMVESISDSFISLDRDWRFTYVNRRALGYGTGTPTDAIGRTIWEVFPEIVGTPLETFYREAMEEREPMTFENRSAVATGRTFEIRAYPSGDGLSIFGQDITERKRAEEALRESEARFREILELSRDVISRHNLQTRRFDYISPSCVEVSGWTSDELLAMDYETLDAMIHPDDRAVVAAMDAELYASGTAEAEYRQRTKDGGYYWTSASLRLIKDEAGQPLSLIASSRDITERKRVEEAMRESEARFRGIVETADEGIATHGSDGIITYVNQRMADLLGYSRDELIGRSSLDFVDDEEKEKIIRAREGNHTHDGSQNVWKMRRRDGSTLWTLANVSQQRDGAGTVTGYLAMHTDITERRRAEEALRESGEKYRQLFESMGEGFVIQEMVYDDAGRPVDFIVLDINPAYEKATGVTRDQVVGRRITEILPSVEPLWFERYNEVVQTRMPVRFEAYNAGLDRWFGIFAYPLQEKHRFAVIITDIGERRQAEEAVRESEERLARAQEIAHVGSWDWDIGSDRLVWSDETYRIFGLRPGEIRAPRNEDFLAFVHPDDQARVAAAVQDALVDGHYDIEFRFVGKGGDVGYAHSQGAATFANGAPVRMEGIVQDITERTQAEEALRESEANYRTLYTSIDQGYFVIDVLFDENDRPVDLYTVEANEAATRMLGRDWSGKRLTELSPDYEEYWFEIFGQVARTGESVRLERYAAPDQRWYDFYVFRIGGPESRRIGNTFLDITERKRVEAALVESRAILQAALMSMSDAVAVSDAAGGLVEINDAFAGFHRFGNRDDCLRTLAEYPDLIDVYLPDGTWVPPELWVMARALRGEAAINAEYTLRRKDTGEEWIGSYTYGPIRDGDGTITGSVMVARDVTDIRRAEEALRRSEENLTLAQEAAHIGTTVWDQRTGRLWWSEEQRRIFGIDMGTEITFERYLDLVHPDDRSYVVGAIDEGFSTKKTEGMDYRIIRPDGEVRFIHGEGRIFYEGDTPSYVIGTVQDVTERKQAEDALRESEERASSLLGDVQQERDRLASLIDSIGDEIWFADTDRHFTLANPRALQEFALSSGDDVDVENLAKSLEVFRPDGSPRPVEEAPPLRALAGEVVRDQEEVIRTPATGELRYRQVSASPVRDGAGTIFGSVSVVRDVTEQKRAAEALRESEANMARAQSTAHLGNWAWDLATGRFTCSDEHCRLYGLAPGDYPIETFIDLVHEDDRQSIRDALAAALDGGAPYGVECRVVRPDGAKRILHGEGEAVRDATGRVTGMFGIAQDITERKQAEAALREYAEELRRSNEDLERYAYVSSHDLQEPLRSIVSFSQLLERKYRGQLGQDADEYIDFIVEGGNRMQTLILDLLAYSRVNSKAQEPRPTDVEAVMAAVERNLDPQLREAGGALSYDPLPTVTADPLQLEQVFSNLVSNAIKFRRQDEPLLVHVSARRLDGFWEFSVQDNGIGIEEQYRDQIFVIFKRLHTKDAYPGTGIGLAIVKRIVDRHGGRVWMESTPGEGSTFYFTLPDGSFKSGGGGNRRWLAPRPDNDGDEAGPHP